MIVVLIHILENRNFRWWIFQIQLVHLVIWTNHWSSSTSTNICVYVVGNLTLHSNCVRNLTKTTSWHFTRLPWCIILLFCSISTSLKVRESGACSSWIERSSFILTFISSSTNLLSLSFWRDHLRSSLTMLSHLWCSAIVITHHSIFFSARSGINRKVALGSPCFLEGRIHLELWIVRDYHNNALC